MKIIHIGDTHWRPLVRHEEYIKAFEDLFEQAEKLKPDCFIFGGDAVHEKLSRITPEIIDCLVWWFRTMSKIAPVHIILGNHDGNLANQSRQDVLSPLIQAFNDDRITLYKDSGVYSISEDVNLCVFSCFDEDGWASVQPSDDKIDIALFHGPVAGSTTDQGHILEGEIDVTFFKDYDYTLLADIHKKQFLTKDKRVAYCGSTLQQNFGESIDKHGFLFWDIRSKEDFDVDFYEVKNRHPFVTIDWDGTVSKVVKEACNWPDGSRFRIRSKEQLMDKDVEAINIDIAAKKQTNHIVFDSDKTSANSDIEIIDQENLNLRDSNELLELVHKLFDEAMFTQNQWDYIAKLIERYTGDLPASRDHTRTSFYLLDLEFSNLFGYGENNNINFLSAKGIYGIFGPNTLGKSTIIAAVLYSLFGALDREPGQGHNHMIVNSRKTECKTKVTFCIDGRYYMIRRKAVRKTKLNKKESLSETVFFWEVDEDGAKLADLSGDKPLDTNKIIKSMIGESDDFLLTSVAAQDDMKKFVDFRSTKRKSVLCTFLGLTPLEEIHQMAKNEFGAVKDEMKSLPAQNWEDLMSDLADDKISSNKEIRALEETQEEISEKIDKLKIDLSSLLSQKPCSSWDIQKYEKSIEVQRKKLLSANEKLKSALKAVSTNQDELGTCKKELGGIDIKAHVNIMNTHTILLEEVRDISHQMKTEEVELNRKIKVAEKLKTVPCGDQFLSCKYIKDSHKEKKNISGYEKLIKQTGDKFLKLEQKIKDLDADESKAIIEKEKRLSSKCKLLTMELKAAKSSVEVSTLTQKNHQDKVEEMEAILADMKSRVMDDLATQISELESGIEDLKKSFKANDQEKNKRIRKIGQIDAEYKKLRKDQISYKKISEKYRIHEQIVFAFSGKGIPSHIIKSRLPLVNNEMSSILRGVVDFDVELEVDDESDKLEIYIDYGDSRRPIGICCGMEKAISSMAIRVALTNMSTLPKTNMLIFDETFNALDEQSIDSVSKMFFVLKKWFKTILIISHNENVKNIADHHIEISKKGKDAYIMC